MQNPIPLEDFFRKPDRVQLRLSPDGRFLGWLEPAEVDGKRRLNVFVAELPSPSDVGDSDAIFAGARQLTAFANRDVSGFFFADDERVVFAQDQGGDENHHLFCVRADGSDEPRDLTPFDGVKCSIVDDLEDLPGELLFQMNKSNPEVFDVYHLELATGEMRVVGQNPGNIQSWLTDHQGRLRIAMTTDGVNNSLLYRETEADEWRCLATYDFKENASPLGFTYDDKNLWVASNLGRDKQAIFEFDLEKGEVGELVFEHPDVDVSGLIRSRRRERTVGVSYVTDRTHLEFWDARRKALQDYIDAALPGRENRLTGYDQSETRYVLTSFDDRSVGSYYLLDAPYDEAAEASTEGFRMTFLLDIAPWLDRDRLVPMTAVSYQARDGLTVPAYLSLPAGRTLGDGGERLPLILNPHGGPWVRDSWCYNPEVQFLCSRGYAVLQPNYRGSAGFGRAYLEASFGQWGLAMQDDITDGVAWAIDSGLADPERIAIYGGSYGGYATLSGITKTPELYKCAVDYVGVSSIFSWLDAFPPYWKPMLEMVHEMVGHPERDAERLRATSPLYHVDKIRCPLFVAQGANDPRVKLEESDQIVAALRERGVDVEYLVKDDEGHGFANEENRFEFYRAMESFFAKHL